MKGVFILGSNTVCAVAGWQNARGTQSTRERGALKNRSEGEREHVARSTRHVAGLS